MAQMQQTFWVLRSKSDPNFYKAATGTYATPKLYMSEGYARAAGGPGWEPVQVKLIPVTGTVVEE